MTTLMVITPSVMERKHNSINNFKSNHLNLVNFFRKVFDIYGTK